MTAMHHLSHKQLDALRLGALEGEAHTQVLHHLEQCERCQQSRAELDADAHAFAQRFDAVALAAETLSRPAPSRAWPWKLWLPGLAGAMAVAALLLVVQPSEDVIRTKGGPAAALEVYERQGDELSRVGDEGIAAQSTLRLRFDPGERKHLRFLWSEGGQVDALHPAQKAPALSAEAGVAGLRWLTQEIEVELPDSGAKLWALFCDGPVSHAAAVEQIEGGTGSGCELTGINLRPRGP